MLKNFDHDLVIEEQNRLDVENEACTHCHGDGGYWTGDGRSEPREWEACECQEITDPFDVPYVCEHCRGEFAGKVFEQYDTGGAICPDCWRAGKR